MKKNNLNGADLDSLILVGGPTYSPVLRDMLKEQITPNVDTSIDPMTAVARGAALYASSIDCEAKEEMKSGTIALDLKYVSNSVETIEFVTFKLLPNECTGNIPQKLYVDFTRNDKGWSSEKMELNEIGDVAECRLMEGKSNLFTLTVYDEKGNTLPCFPNEVSIMQGIVVGSAVLPYNIGIEAYDDDLDRDVFLAIKNLEKNQPIPATGVRNGLKTPAQLRPGIESDKLIIPIYQGEHNSEGSSAVYNDHVFDVIITGDDVPALIPENSDVDITLKVDKSQLMTLEATFPIIGESIEKTIDVQARNGVSIDELQERLGEAKRKLRSLKSATIISDRETADAQAILSDVENRFDGEKSSEDGKMHLLADLRRAFLSMETVEKAHEWESLEAELRTEFDRLEKANNELGNNYDRYVEELRQQTDTVIRKRDIRMGRSVLKDIHSLFFEVTRIYQLVGFIREVNRDFNSIDWKDSNRARQLINDGLRIIGSNPTVEELNPIAASLVGLLDKATQNKLKIGQNNGPKIGQNNGSE